jgi:outer membrane lipoprotein SlyB
MIADVRERLVKVPFVPFVIRTSDGHEYAVPTVDHAFITPRGNRVVVVADNGATNVLGPLHINRIVDQPDGE